jgi:hypothetical protein
MNLMLHVMGKDLRRLRAWLAVWIGLLFLKFGVGFYLVLWSDQESSGALRRLFNNWASGMQALTVLDVALTFLIATLLVHEDSVLGSNRFWMTKPLSGKRLLGAKALGAVAFLGLPPVILSLPWWVLCGFRLPQMALAATQTLVIQMAVVGLAMAVATLADTLARVVIWTIVGILTLGGGSVLWGALVLANRASVPTRFVAEAVVLAVTLTSVIAAQFLTRRLRLSFTLLAGGIALEAGILAFWPWVLIQPSTREDFSEWHAERGTGVRLSLDDQRGVTAMKADETQDGRGRLEIALRAQNVPAGLLLGAGTLQHVWRWPDGTNVQAWSVAYTRGDYPWQSAVLRKLFALPPPRRDQQTAIWEAAASARGIAYGFPPPFDPAKDGVVFSSWAQTWKSVIARARQSPPAYRTTADLSLLEPERLVDLPLTSREWRADGGRGIRLAKVWETTTDRKLDLHGLTLTVVTTEPAFLGDGIVNVLMGLTSSKPDADYLVINRPRGDILRTENSRYERSQFIILGSVVMQNQGFAIRIPSVIRNDKWTSAPDWKLSDAEMAIVGYREVARFRATLDVPQFTIRP